MDTNEQIFTLGAYAKGALDAAASRGVLTQQSAATMLNMLVRIYGNDAFHVEQPGEQAQNKQGGPASIGDAVAAASANAAKTQAQNAQVAEQLRNQAKNAVSR